MKHRISRLAQSCRIVALLGLFASIPSASLADETQETIVSVTFETSVGSFQVELEQHNAPVTTANFLAYVDAKFYDGLVFHRVLPGFVVQGGGYTSNGEQRETNSPINYEGDNGLGNDKGTIAMARTDDPNSASSQFYVNLIDNDFLNHRPGRYGYTVFGKVISGMETLYQIETLAEQDPNWNAANGAPSEPVRILSARRDDAPE